MSGSYNKTNKSVASFFNTSKILMMSYGAILFVHMSVKVNGDPDEILKISQNSYLNATKSCFDLIIIHSQNSIQI